MEEETKYIIRKINNKVLLTNKSLSKYWEGILDPNSIFSNKDHQSNLKEEKSFFGFPDNNEEPDIKIFGIPYNKGSLISESRVNLFPYYLRSVSQRLPIYIGLHGKNSSGIFDLDSNKQLLQDCFIEDLGDLYFDKEDDSDKLVQHVSNILDNILLSKSSFCAIGGDHSVSYYLVKSLLDKINKKLLIIQFDAHHDCGSNILKLDREVNHANFIRYLLEFDKIAAIIQIGVRGLRALGQMYYHPKLIQVPSTLVSPSIVKDIIYRTIENYGNTLGYISFDSDVLDPKDFPLVDFPTVGGPAFRIFLNTIQEIFNTFPQIIGADIVEGLGGGNLYQYEPILHILTYILDGINKSRNNIIKYYQEGAIIK
ncbi:arginase family protein [Thermicanus aegyptius]|uniref:arginase family protein n=1 Tax=Thermicanus aegyptius TaxID=94009 RepID=UPI0004241367|nr:arginase family protein [Thermicanus aegyptius]